MARIPKSKKPLTPESIVSDVQVQVTLQFKSKVRCSIDAPLSLLHRGVADDAINTVYRLFETPRGPEGMEVEIVGDPKVVCVTTAVG
jgi:hypothetical protein